MYRTKKGEWVVYSPPISFTAADRQQVEKRLKKYGVRENEIEELFRTETEKGEGVINVPIGLERLDEEGLLQQLYEDGLLDPSDLPDSD